MNLYQVMTKSQEGGSSNATTESDKVKEKRLEESRGSLVVPGGNSLKLLVRTFTRFS